MYFSEVCASAVVVMDPGSPMLWVVGGSGSKAGGSSPVAGEPSKAEDRSPSPAAALERLAAASSPAPSAPASPSPPPHHHHYQAALVADKYLLLEQVEGSSLCRCVDVRTQEEYVCKVSSLLFLYLTITF